jgi:drug/metabolite transporter (DMT)-like permease
VTKIIFYTGFALVAFAFNSILCRMALRGGEADAVGFTAVRLVSGAVTLITLGYFFGKGKSITRGNFLSAFFLFAYAIWFSLAYLGLNAGTGALILFGCVQLTIIVVALFRGERPGVLEWVGLLAAVGGLIYLVSPGLKEAPPIYSAGLMAAAGIAWGVYTLRGRSSGDPLGETTGNFVWTVPMIVLAAVPYYSQIHLSTRGVLLAVLSGAAASGIGYTAWYAALKHLASTRAAVLQLSVPVIAAAGGIAFLAETATTRLWIAAALILGGIGLTILGKGNK